MTMPSTTPKSPEQTLASPVGSFVITPSDSTDIAHPDTAASLIVDGLYLDEAGTVKVTWANGMIDTLSLSKGGHKMRVRRVWDEDTSVSAGAIHGLIN